MAEKKNRKDQPDKAELNRRWRALSQSGAMSRLRSEGRLVALYVFLTANWTTCLVRMSPRRAGRFMKVYPNTIRRGLDQMVEEGILEKIGKDEEVGTDVYTVVGVVTTRDQGGHGSCTEWSRAVTGVVTSGDRSGHSVCAQRSRAVTTPVTDGDHNAVCFSFSSIENTETNNTNSPASAGAGVGPARRRRPSRLIEGVPPPSAAGLENSAPTEAAGIDSCATLPGEVNT